MALDKAIQYGKEHRKPYYKKCEQVDKSCRCHGGCTWCLSNRIHKYKKEYQKMLDRFQEI